MGPVHKMLCGRYTGTVQSRGKHYFKGTQIAIYPYNRGNIWFLIPNKPQDGHTSSYFTKRIVFKPDWWRDKVAPSSQTEMETNHREEDTMFCLHNTWFVSVNRRYCYNMHIYVYNNTYFLTRAHSVLGVWCVFDDGGRLITTGQIGNSPEFVISLRLRILMDAIYTKILKSPCILSCALMSVRNGARL